MSYLHIKDTFELNQNHHPPARNYPFEQICVERRYLAVLRHFSRNLLSNTSQIITQQTRQRTKQPSLSCRRWQINRLSPQKHVSEHSRRATWGEKKRFFWPKWWKEFKNMTSPTVNAPLIIIFWRYIFAIMHKTLKKTFQTFIYHQVHDFILFGPFLKVFFPHLILGNWHFKMHQFWKYVFYRLITNVRMFIMLNNVMTVTSNCRI